MRAIVKMREKVDCLNSEFNNWESMAEFNIELEEDQDDIFLHCTRITLEDRELLYLSEMKQLWEMVRTCPLVEFPSEYQNDIQKMKDLNLPLSFIDLENFFSKDSFQNTVAVPEEFDEYTDSSYSYDEEDELKDTKQIYENPVQDFDPKFDSDVEKMKAMGLPLGFYNW